MKKRDVVKRKKINPGDHYSAWKNLSIDTNYEVEHVLDSGLIVLKNFLMLVNEQEITKVKKMTAKKFNALSDREKWEVFWSNIKLKGTWHCKHCGEKDSEKPWRASPFHSASVHCGSCDGILTERTGSGQNDPFNWKLKNK